MIFYWCGGVGDHGHICSKQENVPKQPNKSRLKSLKEGVQLAAKRLLKIGFELSSTQPCTPMDGNCLFHSLCDQIERLSPGHFNYKSHNDVRSEIVLNVLDMIESERIFWTKDENTTDWIDRMCKLGTFGDKICMQIFANLVGRDILYIPMSQSLQIFRILKVLKSHAWSLSTEVMRIKPAIYAILF